MAAMPRKCPRCSRRNPDVARFCRHCGLGLEAGSAGMLGAGRAPIADPLPGPEGFQPVQDAANLYFRWEAVGGGAPLLGTESLALLLFNGGYDLAEVNLRVVGTGKTGRTLCAIERTIEEWRRGQQVQLEIPSYELPDRVQALYVELRSAEFGRQQ
jgi:hypothetical protein